jgi:hypothetical protein
MSKPPVETGRSPDKPGWRVIFAVIFLLQLASINAIGAEASDESKSDAQKDQEQSLKQQVVQEHKAAHGNLQDRINVGIGPLIGLRSMERNPPGNGDSDLISHNTTLLGVSLSAEGLFSLSDGATTGLGGRFAFDFAPFKTTTASTSGQLSSNYKKLTAHLHYVKGLSSLFVFKMIVGTEWTDIFIEQNPDLTGDSYVPLVLGGGLDVRIAAGVRMGLEAHIKPMLAANNMPGLLEGSINPGLGGRFQVSLTNVEPLHIRGNYELTRYNGSATGGYPAQLDLIHSGQLLVGVNW